MGRSSKAQILVSCWIFSAVLLHLAAPLIYVASIAGIKEAQHARLASRDTPTLLYLSADLFDAHFDRQERELEVGNVRYDVGNYERKGAVVVCRVIKDEGEQQLVNGMRHESSDSNKIADIKFPLWQTAYLQEPICFCAQRPLAEIIAFCFPANEWLKGMIADSYVSPPPEQRA